MTILNFVAQMTSFVAWPIVALTIVLLMRSHIGGLIDALCKVKWGDLEAEFGKELVRARALVDIESIENAIPSTALTSPAYPEKGRELLLRLAELSPRSVVLEAWREVEAVASKALLQSDIGGNQPRNWSMAAVAKKLLGANLLDESDFEIFSILRDLRNRAAHEREFGLSKDEAIEFAVMAQRLVNTFDNLSRKRSG